MFARNRQTQPWVEQWRRVDRWWLKLQAAYGSNTPADQMVDLFYAFFQNTFQMRDWFVESGVDRGKVNQVFNAPCMLLCRDIANASKHCSLVGKSVDPQFRIVKEFDDALFQAGSARYELFRLIANGRKIDLYGLCLNCLVEVQDFLIREKLWGTESVATCNSYCFGS